MEYEQHKRFRQSFWCVMLSEADLARLGGVIHKASDQGAFRIVVHSGDGEDVFRATDPAFFTSDHIPGTLSKIVISGGRKAGSVSCELTIRMGPTGAAELSAEGHDVTTVAGLFHELVRQLGLQQHSGTWLAQRLDRFWVNLLLATVSAVAVYAAFDFSFDLTAVYAPGFRGSRAHNILVNTGLTCMVFAFGTGGFFLQDRIKGLLPPVTLTGRLTDPSASRRRKTLALIAIVIFPIILNVLANFMTDWLKKWGAGQ